MGIKVILTDLVGVLVFKKDGYRTETTEEINAAKIENLFNHVDDKKLLADIKSQLNLTDKEIETALPHIPAKFELYQPLWNKMLELKSNFRVAIINNGNAIALGYWKNQFDFSPFELFVNSGEEGIKKPDKRIFQLVCQRLGVKPEECLFLDDSLENIESAKGLGMQVIWWNKEDGKEKNLQKLTGFLNSL